jgi:sarcosine oxidase subunit beta
VNKTFDIIIIGGGIIGTSAGYYLSKLGKRVLILEKEFLTSGSTGRCISGIRQQFSTPATIQTAMESVRIFKSMKEELNLDVEWKNSGYLFLAHSEDIVEMLKKNTIIQKQFGLDVEFISADECKKIIPLMDIDGLIGGNWCPSDGQANPFLAVKGFAEGIKRNGGSILIKSEVVDLGIKNGKIDSVSTSSGDIYFADQVLNAAGPWAKDVGIMAGIELQVKPERHEALITERVEYLGVPMVVDYRPDGGYFVQRISGQFIACYTPEKQITGHRKDSSFEFIVEMSKRMYRIIPALKNVSILRQWAGSYAMTPDGSPIIGETDIKGFYTCVGMCGHGFMLGPALGKYISQYMMDGSWPFEIDEFTYGRQFGEKEKMA